jgi:hypothetical protein
MVLVAGSAGTACGSAGAAGCVDWVVVVSVPLPLSLQAAMPSRATADTVAKMSFFITSLLRFKSIGGARPVPRSKGQ